jgi:cytoplasmic iron level regulating protein YaaA (DUF328/UPF0246 family)
MVTTAAARCAAAAGPGSAFTPLPCAAVLILLPPSESKTPPASGAALDFATLAYPELIATRERLLDALVKLSAGRPARALAALGLSQGQASELERNAALRSGPAAPAAEVYTGVLYERLRLPELPPAARARVLIASALWGVVRPDDRIPAYRLSMAARLPRLGGPAARWRPALRATLPDEGLVVDLRSGPYVAAWTPRAAETVAVRAFTERADRRTVVSHMVKATRGDVARLLLEARTPPRDAAEVAELVAASGQEVELTTGRGGASVDVIYRAGTG